MVGRLPRRVEINGRSYAIRTDYRDILRILVAYDDPELEPKEKAFVCLTILYPEVDAIPGKDYEEAYRKAVWFIDGGGELDGDDNSSRRRATRRVIDWEQDERLLFAAVNRVAGKEVRSLHYLHWWTFLGYFSEIQDGAYAEILRLRVKKSKGKPLEKHEQEFWTANRDACQLRSKLTAEERAERDRINALLG